MIQLTGTAHLSHFLAVGFRVQRCFGQQHRVLFGSDSEFVVERMMPHFLHVVPVGDDTVFDGVLDGQHAPLRLRFVSDVAVLLAHAHHDALYTGTRECYDRSRYSGSSEKRRAT